MHARMTINLVATDVQVAAEWYGELFATEPWLRTPLVGPPNYVQFRVGACPDEFGIIDRRLALPGLFGDIGPSVFWHVDDAAAAVARLVGLGASSASPIRARPTGLVTASVTDPFGNVVGVMQDPALVDGT